MGKYKFIAVISALLLILSACATFTESDKEEESKGSDNYPEREIDIVIPYAPGGSGDLQARIIGDYLQDQFDKTVNVVSKEGGAGSSGMSFVQNSKPDGYTIILTAVGPSTLTPNTEDVGYDVEEDFDAISQISDAPYGIAVNSSSDIDSLDELFEKSEDEKVTFGTTGAESHQNLVMSALTSELDDVNMEHVPFDGGAEAISGLLGNHIDSSVNTISELLDYEESGDLKILAVTSDERIEGYDIPTFKELGYDPISTGAWFGFVAPKDTPKEIIEKLDKNIHDALEDDEVIDQFKNAELPIEYLDNEEFTEKIKEENETNAEIIDSMDF